MAKLTLAQACCNNEVAYLAWQTDGKIAGCLGFMITRIHLDSMGHEVERRILPAWVAFETQSNPDWEPQDTSVWPMVTVSPSRSCTNSLSADIAFGGMGK